MVETIRKFFITVFVPVTILTGDIYESPAVFDALFDIPASASLISDAIAFKFSYNTLYDYIIMAVEA